MKIYAIVDEYDRKAAVQAWLMVYRNPTAFNIEIAKDADPDTLPMILDSMAKRGVYTVGCDWSMTWVQQRIVPPERQNIGMILRDNGLKEYDEAELLLLGHGRCAQDDFCIREIRWEELPEEIRARQKDRIRDLAVLEDGSLLVTFRDHSVQRCALSRLAEYDRRLQRLAAACRGGRDPGDLDYREVSVLSGGVEIQWGTGVTVSGEALRNMGTFLSLSEGDLRCVIQSMTMNTAQAAERLSCTRQNINDLVKRGRLKPVRADERNMIFMKSDIEELGR